MRIVFIFMAFVMTSDLLYAGELYQWVGGDGKKHFSDIKPKGVQYEESELKVSPEILPFRKKEEISGVINSLKGLNTILSPKISKLIDKYSPRKLSGELVIDSQGEVSSFTLLNRELNGTDLDKELTNAFLSLEFGEKKVKPTSYVWSVDFHVIGKY